jgi:hypothetical protein
MGFEELPRPNQNLAGIGELALYFWLNGLVPEDVDEKSLDSLLKHSHIAFSAESKSRFSHLHSSSYIVSTLNSYTSVIDIEQVREFHAAALKAGATCNGQPGLRPQYNPKYYAAFVIDSVRGVNFEAVCLKGE